MVSSTQIVFVLVLLVMNLGAEANAQGADDTTFIQKRVIVDSFQKDSSTHDVPTKDSHDRRELPAHESGYSQRWVRIIGFKYPLLILAALGAYFHDHILNETLMESMTFRNPRLTLGVLVFAVVEVICAWACFHWFPTHALIALWYPLQYIIQDVHDPEDPCKVWWLSAIEKVGLACMLVGVLGMFMYMYANSERVPVRLVDGSSITVHNWRILCSALGVGSVILFLRLHVSWSDRSGWSMKDSVRIGFATLGLLVSWAFDIAFVTIVVANNPALDPDQLLVISALLACHVATTIGSNAFGAFADEVNWLHFLIETVFEKMLIPALLIYALWDGVQHSLEWPLLILLFTGLFVNDLVEFLAPSIERPTPDVSAARIEEVSANISRVRNEWASAGRKGRVIVSVGNGAVGHVVNMKLREVLARHQLECHNVIVDALPAVRACMPKNSSFLQCKLETQAAFTKVLGGLQLAPGDFVLDLALGLSVNDLTRWCVARGVHVVNAHVAESATLYPLIPLPVQCERLEEGILAEHQSGTTCVLAHGMNPGLVTYAAKQAVLDLGCRLNNGAQQKQAEIEQQDAADLRSAAARENQAIRQIIDDTKVVRVDFTEIDTQEVQTRGAGNKPHDLDFVSTWSVADFFDETAEAEAVMVRGQKNVYLGTLASQTLAYSIIPDPVEARVYSGYIVPHEECSTFRRLLPPHAETEVRFVYQPTPQMRYCLERDQRLDVDSGNIASVRRTWVPGKDTVPGGLDIVGACVITADGHGQWAGLQCKVEDAWKQHANANATSWLTAAGILMGVEICLDHPDLGACLPEDIPAHTCQLYLRNLGVPDMVLMDVDHMVPKIPEHPPSTVHVLSKASDST